MACLREETADRRVGIVSCDEEGCLLRRVSNHTNTFIDGETPEAHCVLQLRLRAGDAQDAGREPKPIYESTTAHSPIFSGPKYDKIAQDYRDAKISINQVRRDLGYLEFNAGVDHAKLYLPGDDHPTYFEGPEPAPGISEFIDATGGWPMSDVPTEPGDVDGGSRRRGDLYTGPNGQPMYTLPDPARSAAERIAEQNRIRREWVDKAQSAEGVIHISNAGVPVRPDVSGVHKVTARVFNIDSDEYEEVEFNVSDDVYKIITNGIGEHYSIGLQADNAELKLIPEEPNEHSWVSHHADGVVIRVTCIDCGVECKHIWTNVYTTEDDYTINGSRCGVERTQTRRDSKD